MGGEFEIPTTYKTKSIYRPYFDNAFLDNTFCVKCNSEATAMQRTITEYENDEQIPLVIVKIICPKCDHWVKFRRHKLCIFAHSLYGLSVADAITQMRKLHPMIEITVKEYPMSSLNDFNINYNECVIVQKNDIVVVFPVYIVADDSISTGEIYYINNEIEEVESDEESDVGYDDISYSD